MIAALLLASVTLQWTAPGDDSILGTAHRYEMRRSTVRPDSVPSFAWWDSARVVFGLPSPAPAGTPQSFQLAGLPDSVFYYALRTADEADNWSGLSNAAQAPPDSLPPPWVPHPPAPIRDFRLTASGPPGNATHEWAGVEWVNPPDTLDAIAATSLDGAGNRWPPTLRATPSLSSGPPAPGPPGTPQAGWIHWPKSSEPTLTRLVGTNPHGSDTSNAIVVRMGGVPADTNVYDVPGNRWFRTQPHGTTTMAYYPRAAGDNRWMAERPETPLAQVLKLVATQEEVQRADSLELCRLYGYWCLRGERQACGPASHWWEFWRWFE